MNSPRRVLAAVLGLVAICVSVLVAVAAFRAEPLQAGRGVRLAAVLVPEASGSEIVVVDLDAGTVVRRVRLRSLVTDVDVDPVRGTIVAAQTGGVGDLADDAVSFTDPRTGCVRYVTLPTIDPSQVRCVAGRALVMHAVVDSAGFVVTALDLASQRVVATGHAPDGSGLWARAGGMVWTAATTGGSGSPDPIRIDPMTLAATRSARVEFTPSAVVEASTGVTLLGAVPARPGSGAVARLDAGCQRVAASASVAGLPHGAQCGVEVGRALVVGDWNGESPESSALVVLDATSLVPLRTISVGSAPCALAAAGDDLLVVDRAQGVLRVVDVRTGAVRRTIDLGVRDLLCSRVMVVPGG